VTRLRVDFDLIEQTGRGTRFHRALAVLVGVIAVLATVLALLQTGASQQSARASLMTTRISAAVAERVTASQAYAGYVFGTYREALVVGIQGTSRALQGTISDPTGVEYAIGEADMAASDRLGEIVGAGGLVPEDGGPLDPHTADVLRAEERTYAELLQAQQEQRTLGAMWSGRSTRAVLGLTLLALAGVLAGLTAILGEGRAGLICLGASVAATTVAAMAAVTALL
jgi:hypothetical protein